MLGLLSATQIEGFFEVGYVVQPRIFGPSEIARMRDAFCRLERTARKLGRGGMYRGSQFVLERATHLRPMRIHRIVWCGAVEPVLSDFGKDPRLLRMAGQLLGSHQVSQLINQAHFKLPGDGVGFPWHQDSVHRRYGRGEWIDANGRGSYVQTVVAIDDVNEENGPLQIIPGTCKLGHREPPEGAEGWLPEPGMADRAVTVTMDAGSVLLFGPYAFHRSMPNESSSARRVLINGYAYPGANTRVYPGQGAGRLLSVG